MAVSNHIRKCSTRLQFAFAVLCIAKYRDLAKFTRGYKTKWHAVKISLATEPHTITRKMSRCGLLVLMQLFVLGATTARSEAEINEKAPDCLEIDRKCGNTSMAVCGIVSCTVTYHCCDGDEDGSSECYDMKIREDVRVDVPLRCENGGVKVPNTLAVRPLVSLIN